MSSQDRLENVLRDIHVMISKSEVYDADRIIVSKNDLFHLIDRLNASIYEIMDEYELTQQSRDHALREHKKEGEKIIWDASRQAEDIYAASVLYTDEALNHLNRIVDEANITISQLYREFGKSMKQQQETIRENQLELKSQLQLLSDTEKYLKLIEVRNREIEREEADKKGKKTAKKAEKSLFMKPEIKINEEYFRKAGIPLDNYLEEKETEKEEMDLLEDEGVIESTLKKVASDVKKEVEKQLDTSVTNHENKQETDHEIIQETTEKQNILGEAGTLQSEVLEDKLKTSNNTKQQSQSEEKNEIDSATQTDSSVIEDESAQDDDMSIQNQKVQEDKTAKTHDSFLQQEDRGEKANAAIDNIKVNLDAEYFKWKHESEQMEDEAHSAPREKTSFFDKLMGKKKSFD